MPFCPISNNLIRYTESMKKHVIAIVSVLVVLAVIFVIGRNTDNAVPPTQKKPTTSQAVRSAPKTFNKTQYSISDPSSIWLVVNKQRPLNPQDYAPQDLVTPNVPLRSNITSTEKYVRADMATALETMVKAADVEGAHLNLQSGYRSYAFQVSLYNSYVAQSGQASADTDSARPGFSEHQSGLAADLGGTSQPSCDVAQCFGTTLEGKWLAANAYKYGFIIRYPEGKQAVTGYIYEPWHVRYVGIPLATEMHKQGIATLEEFFGLPAAPDYK